MLLFYMTLETVEDSEKEVIKDIYERYGKNVKKYVQMHFPQLCDEADDVVQRVFLDVITYRRLFINSPEYKKKNLLSIITRNVCINLKNKRRNRSMVFTDKKSERYDFFESAADDVDVQYEVEKNDMIEKIKHVLSDMPYPTGDIVLLKYLYGVKNKEIAEIFGLTETNVSSIIHRSLKKIREILRSENYV